MGSGAVRCLFVAILALLCVGCRGHEDVRTLTTWTVMAPSGARRQVTLPARFSADELDARSHVVVESAVSIPDAWRGQPVTLVLLSAPGTAVLQANGVEVPLHELGDEKAWPLREATQGASEVLLRLDVDVRLGPWLNLAPRLSATREGDAEFRFVRDFNFFASLAATSISVFLALLYGVLFALDRERREHGWFVLQIAASLPAVVSAGSGLLRFLAPWTNVVVTAGACIATVFPAVGFERSYFHRARLHRGWLAAPLLVLIVAAVPTTTAGRAVAVQVLGATTLAGVLYLLGALFRDYQAGRDRFPAVTLASAWVLLITCATPDLLWVLGRGDPAGGLRGVASGVVVYGMCQALILGRDHIRSLRQAEQRVRELEARGKELEAGRKEVTLLNEELRRQIAERSRQLADALGRVGEVERLATRFAAGDVVKGRYRVVRPLGEGGMGTVYEVARVADDRRFALKVLTEATTGEAMARLAREAHVAAKLSHEHLVSIIDVDFTELGALFLVMELVDGGSLEALRTRFGDVPWALAVLHQVAAGLCVLHDDGVVHRDLKPGNVLVTAQNGASGSGPLVKIADFGLARIASDAEPWPVAATPPTTTAAADPTSHALTRSGALMGTPMYMAPELARGAREATPSSDMWAFGVLAYEMLAGKPPFLVPPVREALWGRKWPAPPALDVARIDPAILALVERSLDARAESRPSAAEWLSVLAGRARG